MAKLAGRELVVAEDPPRVGLHVRPRKAGYTYKIVDHRQRHYPRTEWVWVLVHLRDDRGHGLTLERTTKQLRAGWELVEP